MNNNLGCGTEILHDVVVEIWNIEEIETVFDHDVVPCCSLAP
jgi:hypothetical protein